MPLPLKRQIAQCHQCQFCKLAIYRKIEFNNTTGIENCDFIFQLFNMTVTVRKCFNSTFRKLKTETFNFKCFKSPFITSTQTQRLQFALKCIKI